MGATRVACRAGQSKISLRNDFVSEHLLTEVSQRETIAISDALLDHSHECAGGNHGNAANWAIGEILGQLS